MYHLYSTKKAIIFILAFTFIGMFIGCGNPREKSTIRGAIMALNETCPIPINNEMTLTTINDIKDTVIYKILIKEQTFKMEYMSDSLFFELIRLGITQSSDSQRDYYRKICNNDFWMKWIIHGQESRKTNSYVLSPDEIKKCLGSPLSKEEIGEMILEVTTKKDLAQLPIEVEKGITFTNVIMNEKEIRDVYTVDENIYNYSKLALNKEELKKSIIDDGELNDSREYVKALVNTNRCFIYDFVGSKSHKKMSIVFTRDELEKIIGYEYGY